MSLPSPSFHNIALFVEVARLQSFSGAAKSLGLSTATLSRRIALFEQQMGVRLFNRTTRRVELTTAGARYFERCNGVVDQLRLADEALLDETRLPSGLLRLSMPVDLGMGLIAPMLPAFAQRYPGVSLDLDLSPEYRDLVAGGFDVAFRLGSSDEPSLVSRRIGWMEQGLYAAPAYLSQHGEPADPADLLQHACIAAAPLWYLERDGQRHAVKVSGRVKANNHGLMALLAEQGLGIAALAPRMCRAAITSGRLVPVLPSWAVPRLPVCAVSTSRLQTEAARRFVDFVAVRFAAL
ncbi:MAG: LysR family transcriptional regulator [Hydrogenophaga sp.]|jgi:DNA-binding transcriptional LysR family regulator|nr:LysR family transcriptional regulator [Hydrogenophaga sp.]